MSILQHPSVLPTLSSDLVDELADTGFKFDLVKRNLALAKVGVKPPRAVKTGTTIVAALFKDGVVVAADSRATAGGVIADKNCVKVHHLTDCIYACGAGTAADLDQVCRMLESTLHLYELNNAPRRAPISLAVATAKQHLFKYQGHVGAYLIIGGVDGTGPRLVSVSASGNSTLAPFLADGSGSYAAISIFEKDYVFNMTEAECIAMVSRAVQAGMHGDNMSGNSYRMTIVKSDFTHREIAPQFPDFAVRPEPNDLAYMFRTGTTKVLKQKRIDYDVVEEKMEVSEADK